LSILCRFPSRRPRRVSSRFASVILHLRRNGDGRCQRIAQGLLKKPDNPKKVTAASGIPGPRAQKTKDKLTNPTPSRRSAIRSLAKSSSGQWSARLRRRGPWRPAACAWRPREFVSSRNLVVKSLWTGYSSSSTATVAPLPAWVRRADLKIGEYGSFWRGLIGLLALQIWEGRRRARRLCRYHARAAAAGAGTRSGVGVNSSHEDPVKRDPNMAAGTRPTPSCYGGNFLRTSGQAFQMASQKGRVVLVGSPDDINARTSTAAKSFPHLHLYAPALRRPV